jgi:hypothetical protein
MLSRSGDVVPVPYSQVVNKPTKIAGFNQQDRGDTDTIQPRIVGQGATS